jgi:formylglycine-generating enzyme required for sulfatase activity
MTGTTSLGPKIGFAHRVPAGFVAAAVGLGALFGLRALIKRNPPPPPAGAEEAPAGPAPGDTFDDVMVNVPGGTFRMGAADGDLDERPAIEVTVATLEVDATEVTVAAFARCVTAGKCAEPDTGMYCNWHKPGRERHPVNCVDLKQAIDYCAFAGKRLPTEEEWEHAARGDAPHPYPWGDGEPGAQLCWNGEGNDLGRGERAGTCPVASFPAGRSPFGAFDMAGNVWEWTASGHCPYDHRGCAATARVIRGGAWSNVIPRYVRAQGRGEEAPVSRHDTLGFRCVRNQASQPPAGPHGGAR